MTTLASDNTVLKDRRRKSYCRLPIGTQRFLKFWPLMLSFVYSLFGLWPSPVFGGSTDVYYSSLALIVSVLGIFATIFWKAPLLRNILASVALARSASIIMLAMVAEPPLPLPTIMRLMGAGVLAIIFFRLAIVEVPHIKALRDGY